MAALWLSSSSSHYCLFGYRHLSKPSQRSPPPNTTSTSYSTCRASWQELAGVLVFSAIPFTAVKAIANSSLGATLQKRLMETKASAVLNSSNFNASAQKAREYSFWYGDERPRWLGPIPYDYPAYLTGELPGDYGFDVLGLSQDPVAFHKYFNFEILHARWAMLASLGALVPELLDLSGVVHFIEPVWWRVGYAKLKGDTLDYLGIPGLHIAGSQGVLVIAVCQALLMVGPEYARYCGIEALEPLGIYLPGDLNYPGGILFDPLGLSKDPVAFEELKVKEIKNGRLAMIAWLGFSLQAAITAQQQQPKATIATAAQQQPIAVAQQQPITAQQQQPKAAQQHHDIRTATTWSNNTTSAHSTNATATQSTSASPLQRTGALAFQTPTTSATVCTSMSAAV